MTTKDTEKHKNEKTWEPGQSGNPGGRSPRVGPNGETVAQLARAHTAGAIDTLVALFDNADPDVKMRAANSILDRGWGKPKESVDIDANVKGSGVPIIQIVRLPAVDDAD